MIRITGSGDGSRKKVGQRSSICERAALPLARDGPFWEGLPFSNPHPLPRRSIRIMDLGEFRDLIYGLQSLRGKILSRKELQSEIKISRSAPVSRKGISQSRLDEHERSAVLCKTRGSGLRIVIVIMGNPEIDDSPELAVWLVRR